MKIQLVLNHAPTTLDVEPGEYLLEALRKHHVVSVRRGCDSTSCGVCTVLLDRKPVPSCSVLAIQAAGHDVTTVEGIVEEAEKLSAHFGVEGADQCGFCNPAVALVCYALKQENAHATSEEIERYLLGNLCRCSGYKSQEKAIAAYLEDQS